MSSLVDRLYGFIKSRKWSSELGAALLPRIEDAWAHVKGWLWRGQLVDPKPTRTVGLAEWRDDPTVLDLAIPIPEHRVVNSPPRSIYEDDPEMFALNRTNEIEAGFVARIEEAHIWRDGTVMLESGELIEESMLGDLANHRLLSDRRLPRATSLEGLVAVISSRYGRGFYHWVFDSLARLALIEQADAEPDLLLVNYRHVSFQREWLELLGVDPNKVRSGLGNPWVRVDEALLPQIPGRNFMIPEYAATFLNRKVMRSATTSVDSPRLVYVSRQAAARRRISNEAEVQDLLDELGFEVIVFETVPLRERAQLLSSAEIFLCPEGAGLTNLLFCNPQASVIEIFTDLKDDQAFGWNLSNRLGMDYYYLLADPNTMGHISIDDMRTTIEMALGESA